MYLFQTHTVYIKKEYAVDAANAKSLGGSGDRAALVEGTILHAALVHASDNVEVALVAPRGGPRVGNGPVLKKKVSPEKSIQNPKH
jgi:hypothetical protein